MTVSSSSSIYSLQPILDSERLIRVGGSLSHSDLPYSQQHPIILHRKAHLTNLLVQHLHLLHLHAGPTLLLGTLSHEYYVVGVFNSTGQVWSSKEPSLITDGGVCSGPSLNTLSYWIIIILILCLSICILSFQSLRSILSSSMFVDVRFVFVIVTCFSYFCLFCCFAIIVDSLV